MKMNFLENINSSICWGCLSSGRKKVILENDKLQYIIDIIDDYKISNTVLRNVSFCWECAALFDKILKFRNQVKTSHQEIIKCLEKNDDITALAKPTKLSIYRVFNISVDNFTDELNILLAKDEMPNDEHESNGEAQTLAADHIAEDDFDGSLLKQKKSLKSRKKKKKERSFEKYKEVMLSVEEIEREREVILNKEEFVNARFKCMDCLDIFANGDDLNDHIEVKHNAARARRAGGARRFACTRCAVRSRGRRGAARHYDEAHAGGLDLVADPPASAASEDNAQQQDVHGDAHNGTEDLYMCEHCPKKFKWKTSLNRHMIVHEIANGRKRQPYCEACGLYFTNTVNLRKHIKTSSKHQIKLKLIKLSQDSSHTEADVEEIAGSIMKKMQTFNCGMCDKRFQWRGNLVRHLQSHATRASRELACAPCGRSFASRATFAQHMRLSKRHASERDFKYICGDCERRFPSKAALRDHANWEHLKNFLHRCADCHKVFKHRLNLQQHVQTVHNKARGELLCHLCGRAFPNKSKLTSHVAGVHGATPHKCGHCGATFSWRTCLARHVKRLHRDAREFNA